VPASPLASLPGQAKNPGNQAADAPSRTDISSRHVRLSPLPPEPNERLFSLPPPLFPPVACVLRGPVGGLEADPSWHHHPYPTRRYPSWPRAVMVGGAPGTNERCRRQGRARRGTFNWKAPRPTAHWHGPRNPLSVLKARQKPARAREGPCTLVGSPASAMSSAAQDLVLLLAVGSSPISRAVEIVTGLDLLCWVGRPGLGLVGGLDLPTGLVGAGPWKTSKQALRPSPGQSPPRVWRPPGKAWPSTIESWFFLPGPSPLQLASPPAPRTSRGGPCTLPRALSWRHFSWTANETCE
jgi:hypothetical protein